MNAAQLLEPFQYQYMLKAMGASVLVGAACAFLSCFVILRGWSLMGDALSHSVVPGVAVAHLAGLPFALGAFVAGLLAALGMGFVKARTRLREDAVIGVVFTAMFALGMFLLTKYPSDIRLLDIALGNLLAVSDADLLQVALLAGGALLALGLKWRDLLLASFDEQQARALGLRVGALRFLLLALLSAVAVAALQAVGACLVIAMLITPGATAYLLTDRFGRMIAWAVALGAGAAGAGAYASYFLDCAPGGCIVVLQTLLFAAAFYFAPKHGVLAQRRGRAA